MDGNIMCDMFTDQLAPPAVVRLLVGRKAVKRQTPESDDFHQHISEQRQSHDRGIVFACRLRLDDKCGPLLHVWLQFSVGDPCDLRSKIFSVVAYLLVPMEKLDDFPAKPLLCQYFHHYTE